MSGEELRRRLERRAGELGFSRLAVAPAEPLPEAAAYRDWAERGMAGEMAYMGRQTERRSDVLQLVPGARSVLCVALNYHTAEPHSSEASGGRRGWISRYAWGEDYHRVLGEGLEELAGLLREEGHQARPYVDTGAVLERAYAARAGLGWIGKNTMLLDARLGSWFFLGLVITSAELPPDRPAPFRCGTCRACLTACPTGAIVAPGVVDARRCISYLTIELRGPIPRALRPLLGSHVFGCDLCQEVCPWNREVEPSEEERLRAREGLVGPELVELLGLSPEDFARRFQRSAVRRTKRAGLLRNAAVALGNWGAPQAVPALKAALSDHEALVRGHAAWALGQVGGPLAREALAEARRGEQDPWVVEEIERALEACGEQR